MKKSPVYLTIANDFRKKIYNGELKSGEQLPNQQELAKLYQTSLMTVRQALEVLSGESLIESVHGIGTFVSNLNRLSRNYSLLGFNQEMHLRSIEILTKISDKKYDIRHAVAASNLGLAVNSELCVLSRIRYFNELPIIYQHSFIAPGYRNIIERYEEGDSLYDLINRLSGQTIKTWREIINPIILDEDQAVKLNSKPGECALSAIRCTYTSNNTPILYDEAILSNRHVSVTSEKSGNASIQSYQIYDVANTDPLSFLRSFTG